MRVGRIYGQMPSPCIFGLAREARSSKGGDLDIVSTLAIRVSTQVGYVDETNYENGHPAIIYLGGENNHGMAKRIRGR